MRRSLRAVIAVAATLAVLGPLGYFWQRSLVPSSYDMMAMGYPDDGGGPATHGHTGGLSVADLHGPSGPADVSVTLTARQETINLPDGTKLAGYTLNHASPGPELRARQGQLIEVRLVNESVPEGVTLHWHGVDVPNAEDGVAGVTQDAVPKGGTHVYRFVARDAGTYWYHSHQVGHEQVRLGLFGTMVVAPAAAQTATDQVIAVHTYNGRRTINGRSGVTELAAAPGQTTRARIVNTDAGPIRVWVSGAPYQVVAVDGREVHGPTPVSGKAVLITAGGRMDLEFTGPARVDVGAGTAIASTAVAAAPQPTQILDLLSYGTPAPLGFEAAQANRHFEYRIGRRIGFLDGRPGMWWTINGHTYPDVPMFMVSTGDIVTMTIANSSGEVHPMHLHGHHAVVLSRNGVAATGSPWWFDSLDVEDGATYKIAFRADNPGIWVDHCHNLQHAVDGLLAHLVYTGLSTPYRVGGPAGNQPE